jgi:hypothetical protein
MAIFDLFSKRGKKPPATLVYDRIPNDLRIQIMQIVQSTIVAPVTELLDAADTILNREHPVSSFVRDQPNWRFDQRTPYWVECLVKGNFEECIDAIEVLFAFINTRVRGADPRRYHPVGQCQGADDAIDELNARFLSHGVGYQFSKDEGRIVRVDSEHLHKDAVEPAMRLLAAPGFEGPAQEFADAHQQHRAGNAKDALTAAVRAFESTMKAICDARGWTYDKNKATAKPLLDVLFAKGLIPPDLEAHFGGLRAALESGLPTIANRMARHGQGSKVKTVDDHIVAFGMHLCAAAIVFLVEAHRAKM